MTLWSVRLGLNFLWAPIFFVVQRPWIALVEILVLLAVIRSFIWRRRAQDRVSALAFVRSGARVAYASYLNLSIAVLN